MLVKFGLCSSRQFQIEKGFVPDAPPPLLEQKPFFDSTLIQTALLQGGWEAGRFESLVLGVHQNHFALINSYQNLSREKN
jgi:hypothetical protein